jgi:hypothetical protein
MPRASGHGAAPMPQLPTTTVVTPPRILKSISGRTTSAKSSWVCTSMKPGASARPAASSDTFACRPAPSPTDAIRSPLRATSARLGGAPVPSYSVAPRIRTSPSDMASYSGAT